jgi:YbbR domain-containing protein
LSESRNTWGLRLLAVMLAITAWFVFTVEKRERLSEKVVEATVRYDNFPGLIVVERLETVRVGVRGTVSRLRSLNPFAVDVFVELSNPDKGVFEVPLTSENVFLPPNLEVVSIEPNIIQLKLDREAAELLPVLARLEGEPAAGAKVQHAEVIPPNVLVRGPEDIVRSIGTLATTPVYLTGHALDFQEQAAVLPPDPLVTVVQPAIVNVRVRMEIPSTELENEADKSED